MCFEKIICHAFSEQHSGEYAPALDYLIFRTPFYRLEYLYIYNLSIKMCPSILPKFPFVSVSGSILLPQGKMEIHDNPFPIVRAG